MFERAVSTGHFGSHDRRLKAKDFMLKEQPKFAVYRRNYGIRSFLPLDGFCCHKHIINQSDAKTIFLREFGALMNRNQPPLSCYTTSGPCGSLT